MDVCRTRRPPISHLLSVWGTSSQLDILFWNRNPLKEWLNGVSWSVYPHHWHSHSPVTPNAVSHYGSVNFMVQSIGQCVCTLHIFLSYLRLQTKPLFWLKAAFYKLNDLSPLLGWENPFFLLFQHPRILYLTFLWYSKERGSQVSESHWELEGQNGQRGCPSSSSQNTSVGDLGHANIDPLAWCRSQGSAQHSLFKL